MVTAALEQSARVKARGRRIAIDKKRVERERQESLIEDAATTFFAGTRAKAFGLAAVEATEDKMGLGIRRLLDAGLTAAQAAELCEITNSQLQKLRARTGGSGAGEPPAASAGRKFATSGEVVD